MNFTYHGPHPKPVPATILSRLFDYKGNIGCDVETVSLEDRTPLGAGFAISPDESFYFSIDSHLFPWQLLRNPNVSIIFHNSGFDVKILEDFSGFTLTNIHDSCVAANLLGLPARLADLCFELFGRTPRRITDLIGTGKDQITMRDVPEWKVAERGCLDAQDALEAWEYLIDMVPVKALDLETRILPVTLDIERRGMYINKEKVNIHRRKLERDATYYRTICEGVHGFSPGSSLQLGAALEAKGYTVLKRKGADGKKRPRLNKEILETYYSVEPMAVLTLKYRRATALLTHLIRPLDEGRYIGPDSKIHPNINITAALSGRISRSNPATQNLTEELRDIVEADPGEILYDWDMSQIEPRWAAYLWNDKALLDIFASGGDPYKGVMNELLQAGVGNALGPTPERQRWTSKQILLTVIYGGDEHVLYERYQIPMHTGTALIQGLFRSFPGIYKGIETTRAQAMADGYTQTYLGRIRNESEKLQSNNPYLRTKALRELVNHVIQGSAAETLKEDMWNNRKEPQIHTVHDQIILSVPPGYNGASNHMHKVAPFETPIKIRMGLNWKDLVEV